MNHLLFHLVEDKFFLLWLDTYLHLTTTSIVCVCHVVAVLDLNDNLLSDTIPTELWGLTDIRECYHRSCCRG